MLTRLLLFISLTASAFAQQAVPNSPDWTKPFPPFKILGNIYWVGTWDLSTYLITTPQGNILINSGLAETVPLIKSGVEQLGFKMSDTKILMATHGHFDHVAGLADLQKMTGAKIYHVGRRRRAARNPAARRIFASARSLARASRRSRWTGS